MEQLYCIKTLPSETAVQDWLLVTAAPGDKGWDQVMAHQLVRGQRASKKMHGK